MHRQPTSWHTLLTKLGFGRKKNRVARKVSYHRQPRYEEVEDRRMLATFTVNSPLDNGDGANTTVREAIEQAQNTPGLDTIQFAANLNNQTIALTQGELSITESVTIDGRDGYGVSRNITINGGGGANGVVGNFDGFSIFDIFMTSGKVEINSLTLTGGDAGYGTSGGAISYVFWGDPAADERLTVKNSTITANAAYVDGGGIFAIGNVRIENSTISGNTAGLQYGGGIKLLGGSDNVLEVVSSTISGNKAVRGGGIDAYGDNVSVNIQSSLITGNQSTWNGGGIAFQGR